jgi:NAD(P)-dependent dehydrogenase (short-subunit alcohol dehydrogenase family)
MGLLDGRVGIVTGAAGNLGRPIAKLFAAEGGTVVVNDINAEGAEAVAEEIRKAGHRASVVARDSSRLADAAALVDGVVGDLGRIDAVLLAGANLAGQRIESIEEMSEEHFLEIVRSHVGGHFAMIKAVIPHMKRQRYGRIVGFASSTGMVGDWGFSHYAAGKGGVTALIRTAAIELDAWGISANALSPAGARGGANTPILDRRTGPPEGVAPLAVYLASEEAGYINGHVFEGSGSGRIGVYGPFVPARQIQKPGGWSLEEVREIVPGLFDVSYTNEPRQRPALGPRDPLLVQRAGEMIERLPTGLSPILTEGLEALGLLDPLGLPGYNRPGSKVTPADESA